MAKPSKNSFHSSDGGFTIIELMVAVGIIGMLATIVFPYAQDALLRARIASTQNNLRLIRDGIELHAMDTGRYPWGSSEAPTDFVTNYDTQEALTPLLGSYLPNDPGILTDYFTRNAVEDINNSIALQSSGVPTLFGYGYYDYSHFLVPPREPIMGYGVISFGPDGEDSKLGLRPLPGIGELINGSQYDPSNGLRSRGDLGVFGGNINFPGMIP